MLQATHTQPVAVNDTQSIMAELLRLKAENEALKSKGVRNLSFKIGAKGGLSVYGMGRFPVTLYRTQWERLIQAVPDLQAFIKANESLLKEKP